MKNVLTILISVIVWLAVPTASFAQTEQEILVSAAISLKEAFTEINKIFEAKNKHIKISFNFGASGDLKTQIIGGAPVNVFASASPKEMEELEANDKIIQETRLNFAGNEVVLIVPADSQLKIETFTDLQKPEIKKIALGNSQTVPAGRYADEVLTYYKLKDAISLDRCVFGENVRQVLDYVARKEVDAGIVYTTDAKSRAKDVKVIARAPAESHKPIIYPIAAIKGEKNEAAAKQFIACVVSPEGLKVLEHYGFTTIPSKK